MGGCRPCLFLFISTPSIRVHSHQVASRTSAFLSRPHRSAYHRSPPLRLRPPLVAIAANGDGTDEGAGDDNEDDARPSPEEVRAARVNNLRERLAETRVASEHTFADTDKAKRYLERETQLLWLSRDFVGDTLKDCDNYFKNPSRQLVAASLAILFGFFAATSATTIIGSVADWDPLAAAVLLVWTEAFTRYYYHREEKTLVLRLVNAFKIGLIYGCAVDACKVRSLKNIASSSETGPLSVLP